MAENTEIEPYVNDAWQSLLDKDDRNSPADYPDMCLITKKELAEYIADAVAIEAGLNIVVGNASTRMAARLERERCATVAENAQTRFLFCGIEKEAFLEGRRCAAFAIRYGK